MNKVFVKGIFATAIAAMALTSCSSDITEDVAGTVGEIKHVTFKATSETPAGTRTEFNQIDDNTFQLNWKDYDEVKVWNTEGCSNFIVSEITADNVATLEGDIILDGANQYLAAYPASEDIELDGNTFKNMSVPAEQTADLTELNIVIDEENFTETELPKRYLCDPKATPMVAVSNGENMVFKNACSYAMITLPSTFDLIKEYPVLNSWIIGHVQYFTDLSNEIAKHTEDFTSQEVVDWNEGDVTVNNLCKIAKRLFSEHETEADYENLWNLMEAHSIYDEIANLLNLVSYGDIVINAGEYDEEMYFYDWANNNIWGKFNVTLNSDDATPEAELAISNIKDHNKITYHTAGEGVTDPKTIRQNINLQAGNHFIAILPLGEDNPLGQITVTVKAYFGGEEKTLQRNVSAYTLEEEEDPENPYYRIEDPNKLIKDFERGTVVKLGNVIKGWGNWGFNN